MPTQHRGRNIMGGEKASERLHTSFTCNGQRRCVCSSNTTPHTATQNCTEQLRTHILLHLKIKIQNKSGANWCVIFWGCILQVVYVYCLLQDMHHFTPGTFRSLSAIRPISDSFLITLFVNIKLAMIDFIGTETQRLWVVGTFTSTNYHQGFGSNGHWWKWDKRPKTETDIYYTILRKGQRLLFITF